MKRDPRMDPQPGDIVRKEGKTRRVAERKGGDIKYFAGDADGRRAEGFPKFCWITTWRSWCKDAEVL